MPVIDPGVGGAPLVTNNVCTADTQAALFAYTETLPLAEEIRLMELVVEAGLAVQPDGKPHE